MAEHDQDGEGDALALLLPFYINGSLSAADRERVEAALAVDAELRAELEALREFAALVRQGGAEMTGAAEAAPQDRLEALLGRIDAEAPAAPVPFSELERRRAQKAESAAVRRRLFPVGEAFWKPAFAAAAAVAVIQFGAFAYLAAGGAGAGSKGYETLSGSEEATPPRPGAILLRLAPEARIGDIEALLERLDLEIVGGPRGGTFQVASPGGSAPDQAVRELRASPLVSFAGPAS